MANIDMTIADMMKEFLSNDEARLSGVYGSFTAKDFKMLMGVVDGTLDDFIIFSNAGGKKFDIWHLKEDKQKMIDHLRQWAYAYKIEGKEVVLRKID